MAKKNSNKVLMWVIVIVVILAIIFTWNAMTSEESPALDNTQSTVTEEQATIGSGTVGINLIPEQTEGGE